MKKIIVFALSLLFLNTATAEDYDYRMKCDTVNSPPAKSALSVLVMNGYLTSEERNKYEDEASENRKSENITLKTIGRKKIGSLPFYEELLPPQGPWPFDSQRSDDTLYQMVQYLRIKNAAGKVFEFVVIGSVAEYDCGISTPLIIEISPQHKIVGKWEDYLQVWERYRNKEKDITPNLVK